MEFFETHLRPLPDFTKSSQFTTHVVRPTEMLLSAGDVDQMAQELNRQFQSLWSPERRRPQSCTEGEAIDYIQHLQIHGRYQECADYAEDCAKDPALQDPQILTVGAICAGNLYQHARVKALLEVASQSRFSKHPNYDLAIYQRASFGLYNEEKLSLAPILGLHPSWRGQEKNWEGLLRQLGHIDLKNISKSDIYAFLEERILAKDISPSLLQILKTAKIQLLTDDYNYASALAALKQYHSEIENPLHWYYQAYLTLYYGLGSHFVWAKKIYDVYDRYSHPGMYFPLEENTYTYSEIHNQICRNQFLTGKDSKLWQQTKKDLSVGKLSFDQARMVTETLLKSYPAHADLLTAQGTWLFLQDNYSQAMQFFWQAHQACRYYNRAHWGMALIKRHLKSQAWPDYQDNLMRMEREIRGRSLPVEFTQYILNPNILNSDLQKRIIFGSRIWLPFVKTLYLNGYRFYLKLPFELFSEIPGQEAYKDLRVDGPDYPNDNRLRDDLRGAGGDILIADWVEVSMAPQMGNSLLGHEMSHQIHSLMEKKYISGSQCINKLYAQAKRRNVFLDGYSSLNKEEYFAQAATHWLIPMDAPVRFGVNKSWLQQFDPENYKFLQSLENSNGDFIKVSCF